MFDRRKILITVLLIGSVWGGLEAMVNAASHDVNFIMPRSVILGFIAVLILTSARLLLPKVGTTLAAGIVAAGFKFLSFPDAFTCQIAAVIGQAAILEGAFFLAERRGWMRKPLILSSAMIATSYLNSLVFAFSQAYLFGNQFWFERGADGLLRWSFTTGSVTAVACAISAALACALIYRSIASWEGFANRKSTAFISTAIAVSASFWIAGAIVSV